MHLAVNHGNVDMVRLLVGAGADVTYANKGMTPGGLLHSQAGKDMDEKTRKAIGDLLVGAAGQDTKAAGSKSVTPKGEQAGKTNDKQEKKKKKKKKTQ